MDTYEIGRTNRLLGYPQEARLLIINADDFGMCHSVNTAIMDTLLEGVVRSTTLMVPCPWSLHAQHFLSEHLKFPFGIHLTVISDSQYNRWAPLSPKELVPTLIDQAGFFYDFAAMPVLLARAELDQLEIEFRVQIESVLESGLEPTHLDWHALRFGHRTDILDLMTRLAIEYGLAQRVIGETAINNLQHRGLPTIDSDFLDSYGVDPTLKLDIYERLLRELPTGLSEWAVHPGLDNQELLALEPSNNHERQSDYDFFTSPRAKEIIDEEGILLIDYRGLQSIWRGNLTP